MSRPAEAAAVLAAAAFYAAWLLSLGRGITLDMWDGYGTLQNALGVAGLSPFLELNLDRPPLGWLALLPAAAWGHRDGGSFGAQAAVHAMMPVITAAAAAGSYFFFKTVLRPWTAALAALLLAANPLLIQYSAFALLDTFAVLSVAAFAWAARSWERRPNQAAARLLAAAAAAAALSKYHLLALTLVPAACLLLPPRGKTLEAAKAALLLPGVLLCVLAALALLLRDAPAAGRALFGNFWLNATRPATPVLEFFLHLWNHLGMALALLCAAGLVLWLREGEKALVLSLLLPLAAMSLLIGVKEERYLIPLLPLAYAAAGRALDEAWRRSFRAPAAALGLALVVAAGGRAAAAAHYLSGEPTLRTKVPGQLVSIVEEAAGEGCVTWMPGLLTWRAEKVPPPAFYQQPIIGSTVLMLLARRRVVEPLPFALRCDSRVLIVPRMDDSFQERWAGEELGEIHVAADARALSDSIAAGSPRPRPSWRILSGAIEEARR